VNTAIPFRIAAAPSAPSLAGVFADLHSACFAQSPQEIWSASTISTLLGTPGTMGLIALGPGDQAIGFIIGRAIADESEVVTLCVSPSARRQGIATALIGELKELLAPGRRILLEVAMTNREARALYESLGFHEVGRRPAYYHRDGKTVDALVLARDNSP
jgi:ribosomal-protein-alanine N-acetyltransferase